MSSLPPLPPPAVPNTRLPVPDSFNRGHYTAAQMREYARSAIGNSFVQWMYVAALWVAMGFVVVAIWR